MKVPDIRFINREILITRVAEELGLRVGTNGNIHCWRHHLHQNGDRTASVGIRKSNNTVKCFGCGAGPFNVVDLVISVLELDGPGKAARWIAGKFPVPEIGSGRHIVEPERFIFQLGHESEIGLLVHSGLWARLSATARAIVPVLLELAEREPEKQTLQVAISYRALMRFSGVASPNGIAEALRQLEEIHWLSIVVSQREPGSGPVRPTSSYLITPRSDELLDLANANFKQMREEIEIERVIRAEARSKRKRQCLLSKASVCVG